MDPITALQVAGTILGFVDFGAKLFSSASEFYHSTQGTSAVNEELELVITQISSVATKLAQSENLSPDLEKLCAKTSALATELYVTP